MGQQGGSWDWGRAPPHNGEAPNARLLSYVRGLFLQAGWGTRERVEGGVMGSDNRAWKGTKQAPPRGSGAGHLKMSSLGEQATASAC